MPLNTVENRFPIITGNGGLGIHGGAGGRGGDVHLNFNSYGPEYPDTALLMSLPRAGYAAYDSGREGGPSSCLEGTRVAILKEILSWSRSTRGKRLPVYWLNGLVGIGKSTIAKTVAERAQEKARLGASFFFSRSDQPLRDPRLVFPTLAFQLAHSDREFKKFIVEALKEDPTIAYKGLLPQLQGLILAPLLKIKPRRRPTLIILDALDECEERGAADILRLIFSHAIQLPFLRILITSRPQPHLSSLFSKAPNLAKTVLHDIEASVIQQDIRLYISTELAKIPQRLDLPMPADWTTETQRNELVKKSGKLFVYAATAIRFIGNDRVQDPPRHLSLILNTRSTQHSGATPYWQLDELYMGVLRNSLSAYNHREILERFQVVVGSIVLLREPLPLHSLAKFVKYERRVVEDALRHLHSVIIPPSNIHEAPRIYHPSFLEFIMDASRCSMEEFVIVPVPEQELRHAIRCFELMATNLKRDVARISDPSLLNGEGDRFEQKVRDALSPEVQYACRFWASHLSLVEFEEGVMVEALEVFSMRSILWWFEAMSLIGSVSTAVSSIQEAYRWAMSSKCKSTVVTTLSDAYRFILAHGEVIRGSALHVYHSALPFTPHNTALYKSYYEDRTDSIRVLQGVESEWPQNLSTLLGHSDPVTAVAFSPDGLRLASGSSDGTLCLWDAVSGAPITNQKHHSGSIMTIAFSPSGLRLVSAARDCALWLWDAMSGSPVAKLKGHSSGVITVVFSPDGLRLASGSVDGTLRLWDAISGGPILKLDPLSSSVGIFSHDKSHQALDSDDGTIRLWDAMSSRSVPQIGGGSSPHTRHVPEHVILSGGSETPWSSAPEDLEYFRREVELSQLDSLRHRLAGQRRSRSSSRPSARVPIQVVAFSPNGLRLASGIFDLWLWDACNVPIAKLATHSSGVMTIAFSPDGLHLASGSYDGTLCLWGGMSGMPVVNVKGHSDSIWTVAFSPDGLRLASGSNDGTLCLWDTMSGAPIINLKGHSGSVRALAFSPDGLCLVSGSHDCTLWLWDVMLGSPIPNVKGHSSLVRTIAFSPDGMHLASGSDDCTIWVWDAISGMPITKLKGHSDSVRSIAFSPDGSRMASGSKDHTICLWDGMSSTPIVKLKGHSSTVTIIAFSPDGFRLASRSDDGSLCLWDAMFGMRIATLEGQSPRVSGIPSFVDGSLLIARADVERFIPNLTPQPFMDFTGLIWSLRGRWIQVERPKDGHVRRICHIPPHYSPSTDIQVSSQQTHTRIAVGCRDGRVIILTIPYDPFN